MKVGDGHTACAGTESECACDAADGANRCALDVVGSVADALRCQLTIATAFSGTDKHSVPLESAAQVERLGKYSVTGRSGERERAPSQTPSEGDEDERSIHMLVVSHERASID